MNLSVTMVSMTKNGVIVGSSIEEMTGFVHSLPEINLYRIRGDCCEKPQNAVYYYNLCATSAENFLREAASMKLMVIDGNSIINRAYYGIRPLSTREGLYTHAVFGFLTTLLRLEGEEHPDLVYETLFPAILQERTTSSPSDSPPIS